METTSKSKPRPHAFLCGGGLSSYPFRTASPRNMREHFLEQVSPEEILFSSLSNEKPLEVDSIPTLHQFMSWKDMDRIRLFVLFTAAAPIENNWFMLMRDKAVGKVGP